MKREGGRVEEKKNGLPAEEGVIEMRRWWKGSEKGRNETMRRS